MIEKVLEIASREAGAPIEASDKIADVFDSLEYLEFVMLLRFELGPLADSIITGANKFEDLAKGYAVPA
jgi:hypothetical protein